MKAKVKVKLPVPAKVDVRICFVIEYLKSEAEADIYAAYVRQQGWTYNGGYFHGMPCGREACRDYTDEKLGNLSIAHTRP